MLEGLTPPSKFVGTCKVGIIAAELEENDRKILLDAVADTANWPVKSLSKALSERGIQISDSPIYNHRAKTCACFRS
jgi:hypothetical protein